MGWSVMTLLVGAVTEGLRSFAALVPDGGTMAVRILGWSGLATGIREA